MTLTEFMNKRYANRPDEDNIFGVGVSDAEFRQFIIDYLLGEDWYVVDPLGQTQINEIALHKILEKHSKQYRKECKSRKRGKGMNTLYKSLQMPKDFMDAVETIMKYCQNEDCQEDCKNCPCTLAEIRCGDTEVEVIDEQLVKCNYKTNWQSSFPLEITESEE